MFSPRPVFAQVINGLDPTEFARCAARFPMRRAPRGLSAFDHFLALVFAQLTHRESLRDLAACLQSPRAYHAGFRSRPTRTNLAYANRHRDWRVFAAMAQVLMRRVRRLYQDQRHKLELPEVLCHPTDPLSVAPSLSPHTASGFLPPRFLGGYCRTLVSMRMVTGPSLTSATCMSAPNSPAWTGLPKSALSRRRKVS